MSHKRLWPIGPHSGYRRLCPPFPSPRQLTRWFEAFRTPFVLSLRLQFSSEDGEGGERRGRESGLSMSNAEWEEMRLEERALLREIFDASQHMTEVSVAESFLTNTASVDSSVGVDGHSTTALPASPPHYRSSASS
jgi:hypothetical protein